MGNRSSRNKNNANTFGNYNEQYKFQVINNVVRVLAFGMLLYLGVVYYLYHYFGLGENISFLFGKPDVFMDFFNVNYFVHDWNPYGKEVSYPPFATFIATPFSAPLDYIHHTPMEIRATIGGMLSYCVFVLIFYSVFMSFIYRNVKGQGILTDLYNTIIILASFPVLFLLDRGNYLIITALAIYLFIYYYEKGKGNVAVVFLSIAVALKIYPLVLVFLLVYDKKYKDILKVVYITAVLSTFPILFYSGSFMSNIRRFLHYLLAFSHGYSSEIVANSNSISLTSLIKLPLMLLHDGKIPFDVSLLNNILVLIGVGVTLLILSKEQQLWKKALFLILLMNLFQKNSPDYNLVYFIVPMLFFFNKEKSEKHDKWYIAFFGLILIPKTYIPLYSIPPNYLTTVQSILNPAILLAALSIYVAYHRKAFYQSLHQLKESLSEFLRRFRDHNRGMSGTDLPQ